MAKIHFPASKLCFSKVLHINTSHELFLLFQLWPRIQIRGQSVRPFNIHNHCFLPKIQLTFSPGIPIKEWNKSGFCTNEHEFLKLCTDYYGLFEYCIGHFYLFTYFLDWKKIFDMETIHAYGNQSYQKNTRTVFFFRSNNYTKVALCFQNLH